MGISPLTPFCMVCGNSMGVEDIIGGERTEPRGGVNTVEAGGEKVSVLGEEETAKGGGGGAGPQTFLGLGGGSLGAGVFSLAAGALSGIPGMGNTCTGMPWDVPMPPGVGGQDVTGEEGADAARGEGRAPSREALR